MNTAIVSGSDSALLHGLVRQSDTLLALDASASGYRKGDDVADLVLIGLGDKPGGVAASVAALSSGSYALPSGQLVNITFRSSAELDSVRRLSARFAEAMASPSAWANPPGLDPSTHVILHELRVGAALVNPSIAQTWRESLHVDQLPTFVAAHHLARHYRLRDQISHEVSRHAFDSAHWILRECLLDSLAALLAALGETHPERQWHLDLAKRYRDIGAGSITQELVDAICAWPPVRGAESVLEALYLADEVSGVVFGFLPALAALPFGGDR